MPTIYCVHLVCTKSDLMLFNSPTVFQGFIMGNIDLYNKTSVGILWGRVCKTGDFKELSCLGRFPGLGRPRVLASAFRGTSGTSGPWGESAWLGSPCQEAPPHTPILTLAYSHSYTHKHACTPQKPSRWQSLPVTHPSAIINANKTSACPQEGPGNADPLGWLCRSTH